MSGERDHGIGHPHRTVLWLRGPASSGPQMRVCDRVRCRDIRQQVGIGTFAAVVFAAVATQRWLRDRRARAELAEASALLRGAAVQAERLATAQAVNRDARDIHDRLAHSLTVVQMQVRAARALLETDTARADELLAKAQRQALDGLDEVRRSVAALQEPYQLSDSTSNATEPTRGTA